LSTTPHITVENIRHWYYDTRTKGVVEAISHAETKIGHREFVSIVGPSGCGKTTLLNMIAGMVVPSQGTLSIDGRRVSGIQPDTIGYMVARDTLLPWRTVIKNVEFALEFGSHDGDRRKEAEEFVSLVGLDGFEDHYPDQLSHGMRQRAALARTLVGRPKVLLMDEPFGALDAQTRLLMQNEFVHLWEARQTTVVFVTHDLIEAMAMSDRVLVFSARPGRIKADYRVDFPRPRIVDELQDDPAFQALHRNIWGELKVEAYDADHSDRQARGAAH